MKTSQQWWKEMKAAPELFNLWLQKQYHGEITAVGRIKRFAEEYGNGAWTPVLGLIAAQEADHAEWVGELLVARGLDPKMMDKEERYWDHAMPAIESFESGAAVAAHAEFMRLERIAVIASDFAAPDDVRRVFSKILGQEQFHAAAFRCMAGEVAMMDALAISNEGREIIGLIPASLPWLS